MFYVCIKGCKIVGGDFDFDELLERLGIVIRLGDVEKVLKFEVIFMCFFLKCMKIGKLF